MGLLSRITDAASVLRGSLSSIPAQVADASPSNVVPLRVGDKISTAFAGLGGNSRSNVTPYVAPVTPQMAEQAYRSNWIVQKAIELPPFDETREWRSWQAKDVQIEAIEAEEKRLGLRQKIRQARMLQRLTGGAAILLGVSDRFGAPNTPLDVTKLRKGDLAFLTVLVGGQGGDMSVGERNQDPTSPFFGMPSKYTIGNIEFHPSRIIPFTGNRVMTRSSSANFMSGWFWGDPLLQVIWSAVNNATMAQDGFADLINEAKVDVYGVEGLTEMASTAEGEARIRSRFTVAQQIKSALNALVIDNKKTGNSEGDTWQQKQISWDGMPELVNVYMQIVCGAVDIPASRFLSQAPAGMNATGESDIRNYYDRISAGQENDLRPSLELIDEALIRSATGVRDPDVHFDFNALWQLSATEKAINFKTMIDGITELSSSGLIPTIALEKSVQNYMIEDGILPGLDGALAELPDDERFPSNSEEEGEDDIPPNGQLLPLRRAANDASPRTLYVSRNLLNGAEFIAWAKDQGFTTTTPADELHVTIMFSRTPVDWMKMGANDWNSDGKGNMTVPPGGARIVEKLGDKGAAVLLFASSQLSWRHEDMKREGASFDFPEYQPHVTITYEAPADLDLSKVEPYRGKLEFGPEIFAEVVNDWEKSLKEE